MRSTQFRRWVLLLLAGLAAVGSGQLLPELNRQRDELGLVGQTDIGDAPPGLVLAGTALGGLRAIIVDALWMRVTNLEREGRFFEIVQLYDWIGKLQPRFTKVWSFAAWNLAYNVSSNFPAEEPQQRWRWVKRGIEVLRDQGIPNNRKAADLYRELAWLYYHKIGDTADAAHRYYKVQLAIEMEDVFGKPPYEERLGAIAAALDARDELLADPAAARLLKAFTDAGLKPLENVAVLQTPPDELPGPARAALQEAPPELLHRLDLLARGLLARAKLKLEPRRMLELMQQYGPIDWRLPDALALYYATRAVELEGDDLRRAAVKNMLVFSALVNLYNRGTLIFDRGGEGRSPIYFQSPHFGFLQRVLEAHREIAERYANAEQRDPARNAYLDFLRDAIVTLYLRNNGEQAARYLHILQGEGHAKDQALEQFVRRRFRETMRGLTPDDARRLVIGSLVEALYRMAAGDTQQAVALENRARFIVQLFNAGKPEYMQLPSFEQFRTVAARRTVEESTISKLTEAAARTALGDDAGAAELEYQARMLFDAYNASRPEHARLRPFEIYRAAAISRLVPRLKPAEVGRIRAAHPEAFQKAQKLLEHTAEPAPK